MRAFALVRAKFPIYFSIRTHFYFILHTHLSKTHLFYSLFYLNNHFPLFIFIFLYIFLSASFNQSKHSLYLHLWTHHLHGWELQKPPFLRSPLPHGQTSLPLLKPLSRHKHPSPTQALIHKYRDSFQSTHNHRSPPQAPKLVPIDF